MRPTHRIFHDAIEALFLRLILDEDSHINQKLNKIMANIGDLNAALNDLQASVDALPGRIQPPDDLQPQVDQVNAIKAEVDAIAPAQ